MLSKALLNSLKTLNILDYDFEDFIEDLRSLVKYSTTASRKDQLFQCAHQIDKLMNKSGLITKTLYLEDEIIPPIVYGEIKSKKNPDAKTLLFYNHYDVQPEDPIELWNSNPYELRVDGNYLYGRGVADDKGEFLTRLKAVEYMLKEYGDVPCNIKFLIEGEEESGGLHLEKYLTKYHNYISDSDLLIWENGLIDRDGRPVIQLGQKGILTVEINSYENQNIDSTTSKQESIRNLVHTLSKIYDNGKILIDGWYKDVKPLSEEELSTLYNDFDQNSIKEEYGISQFVNKMTDLYDINRSINSEPTCNIEGIFYDNESTNVNHYSAMAKLDFRLVPDMIPEKQFLLLKKHLEDATLKNLSISFINGVPPSKTSISNPYVDIVIKSARDSFGKEPIINISGAGTGPMYFFDKLLNIPSICVGGPYQYSNVHSPNEFVRIDFLKKTIQCMINLIGYV
ncbi:MAG: acetylornithine deacetylase [Nitrososphaeraceae archaeon]|nr:acetylornithine deacetylase [Nitrososphaeraceae archaeon]